MLMMASLIAAAFLAIGNGADGVKIAWNGKMGRSTR